MSDDPDRLSPNDVRILDVESAVITGQTLKLVVLEPSTGPLDLESLQTSVLSRVATQPRAMQRVDTSTTEPRWVPASDFDIRYGSWTRCSSTNTPSRKRRPSPPARTPRPPQR